MGIVNSIINFRVNAAQINQRIFNWIPLFKTVMDNMAGSATMLSNIAQSRLEAIGHGDIFGL